MKQSILLALKGALMGAANVIPGVSGGTMALLTGIFERLILAIKSFNLAALQLLIKRDFKGFATHTHLSFLIPIGIGVILSILSLARLLDYLFEHHAVWVWSFFFGLILASVYFVGKRIQTIRLSTILLFVAGTAIAACIAFMEPAPENSSIPYLLLCGAIAMCSMILPGLSGSYVLLLMGNYQLVMIDAINQFQLEILLPIGIGAAGGLLLFARLLAWVFRRFHDQTLAVMTGFIFGSLTVLWPWKTEIIQAFQNGDALKEKVIGYSYELPALTGETLIALAIMATGIVAIILIENLAGRSPQTETPTPLP